MTKTKKAPKLIDQSRCERCMKLFSVSDLCMHESDLCCVDCLDAAPVAVVTAPVSAPQSSASVAPIVKAPSVASAPRIETHARCERCFRVTSLVTMTTLDDEHVCARCATPDKQWYAIALVGPESKIAKNIRTRATKYGVRDMLGRIVSPKVQVARESRNSYSAFTADDQLLGQITADDHEDAFRQARDKFEPRSQKGVFKPNPDEIFLPKLHRIEHTVETYKDPGAKRSKKRVVYLAYGDDDKLLGRILGAKNQKHAQEIATNLYGAKDKPNTPLIVQGTVDRVELTKTGGKITVRNQKAMKGYLLVECKKDDRIFTTIKETPGVYSVLPFTEKVTFEQIERDGLPEYPTGLDTEEIENLVLKPREKPKSQSFAVGDKVIVATGAFTGQTTTVDQIVNETTAEITVSIFGREAPIKIPFAALRKA